MKKFAKLFLSFVLLFINIFSFMSFSNDGVSTPSKVSAASFNVEGKYYFHKEYYYVNNDPSKIKENSILYGEYYDTYIEIKNNKFSMRFGHGTGVFKMIQESNKYKLEMTSFNYDAGYEGTGIPSTTNMYLEAPNRLTVTISIHYDGKTVKLEHSKLIWDHFNFRLYSYKFKYNDNSIESVDDPSKYKFNDFFNDSDDDFTRYANGIEYKYKKTKNNNNTNYTLTLLTEIDDALFETANFKLLIDENDYDDYFGDRSAYYYENYLSWVITFSNDNISSGTLIYISTFTRSGDNNGGNSNSNGNSNGNSTNDDFITSVGDLADSAYGKVYEIVNIVFPIFISVVFVFGLFYGIKLSIKYARAEDDDEKKKAKSALINVIVGCVIAIVIVSIIRLIM